MSKKLFGKFFILLLVVGLLFAVAPTMQAQAATVTVNPGESIQAAIDAAAIGDVIEVASGTYYGAITINKEVTLRSIAGPATTIIHGGLTVNDTMYVLVIRSSNVTLDGFTVTSPNYNPAAPYNTGDPMGIGVGYYGDNSLSNITVTNNWVTQIGSPDRLVNADCYPSVGIVVNGVVNGLNLTNNKVFDIHQTVTDPAVTWGPTGIGFYGYDTTPLSSNVVISGNEVYNISANAGAPATTISNGIRAGWGSGDVTIEKNIVHDIDGRAIAVTSSNNGVATITENAISNADTGIYLGNAGGGVLSGNTFTNVAVQVDQLPVHNINMGKWYATIQDAVTASAAGDVIEVIPGTYEVNSQITINKAITLRGQPGAKLQVSGSGYRFLFTAGGTLDGFEIEKTDKTGVQNIIGIQASNVTISNNVIHGQYVMGDPEVARAMEVSGGYSNISITGNTIYSLRQPAYINGIVTGIVQNNVVYNTRGWVITGGNLTFTGNSWGDGSQPNAVDIAITNDHPDKIGGYYTDIAAMSAANHNAVIEDQRTTPRVLSVVYVDDNAASGGDGTQLKPYQTIQEGIARVVAGGRIHVAAGTYTQNLTINKALTLQGAGDEVVTVNGVAPVTDAGMVNIQASNVTIDGFKFVGAGLKTIRLNAPTTGVTFSNNTVIGATYDGVGAWDLFTSNYNNLQTNLTITGNVFENHGGQIGVYINPPLAGLTITDNVFRGAPTSGPVLGVDGLTGVETISGNDFSGITSTYALLETFGPGSLPIPVAPYFTGNTWPAFYAPIGNMVKLPDTKLLMDPATFTTTDTCTGTREVFVKVQAVSNMAAYQLYLEYDASLITVTNVVNVSPIAGAVAPDNTYLNGVIRFGWYPPMGGGTPPTYDGNYSLIKITFTTKGLAGTGAFTIQPTSMLLSWPDAVETPYEITGGSTFNFGAVVKNVNTGTEFCALDPAFTAASTGNTLQLLADINITSSVFSKAVTFDTNGFDVTRSNATASNSAVFIVSGNNLTITGDGTLTSENAAGTTGSAIWVQSNGTLTLNGATLSGGDSSVWLNSGTTTSANFTMNSGTLTDGLTITGVYHTTVINGGLIRDDDGVYSPISSNASSGGTITINGGEINGGNLLAIYHPQNGTLNINGGTITGAVGIEMRQGTLNIADDPALVGVPTIIGTAGDAIFVNGGAGYTSNLSTTISGGEFTSTGGYALHENAPVAPRTSTISVTGGKFTGTAGSVSFGTVDPAFLMLSGGAYNTDPGDNVGVDPYYVFDPYITYLAGDAYYYITVEPVITSDNIQGYYLVDGVVDDGREFSVSLMNPLTGDAYTDVMFKITIPNASLTDLNNIDFYEEGWGPDGYPKWYDMHFAQVGSDLVGWYGGIFYGGFPLPADGVARPGTLRVDFATPGTYTVNLELYTMTGVDLLSPYDYSANTISLLATKTFTMDVYDAPTVSVVTDPYFIVNEAGNFSVTIANPATGRNYGNNVVFDLVIPGHLPADFGAMSCSFGATTWPVTLLPDGLGGSYTRIGGLDGFFDITAPFGPMTVNCTVTYLAAGTYNVTGKMTDTLATADLTDDRVIQTGVGNVVAYTKPTIVPTFPTDPIFAGVPVSVPVEIINPSQLADPFDLVITVPAGTVITATGYTVTCVGTTCTITVDLTDPAVYPVTLPLVFTFPAAVTPDISFNLYDLDWIGTDDRLLATFTVEDLAIGSGYTVSGTITMQGRPGVLNGIPVTLYWDSTFATYGPSMETDTSPVNFHLAVTYGGTYKFTTLQPRFLNITAEMLKTFTVAGNKTINSLWMRAGNAVWKGVNLDETWNGLYDNTINGADSSLVGTMYGSTGAPNIAGNSGDVNFDNIVNIKDLTLVGGNMGLTSETAYADTIWMP